MALAPFVTLLLISGSYGFVAPPTKEHQRPRKTAPNIERDSFAEMVSSKTFVDKTLFMKTFFERDYIMYVTAPRGFGKTTAMNMLKAFCQIQPDSAGKPLEWNATSNFKLFKDHNLAIMDDEKLVFEHFGQNPVAHFRFDRLDVGSGYNDFMVSFQDMLSETYSEHSYLRESKRLDESEREDFQRIVTKKESGWLTQRGKDLTQLLYTHFGRNSVVLVDDVDAVLHQMLGNPRIPDADVVRIHTFLKGFLVNLVKVNFFLLKSFVTACVRLIPPDVNSRVEEANNLITVNFAEDEEIAQFYGFNDREVTALVKKLGKEAEMDRIRSWYYGYPVEGSDEKLYNMYSVLKYLETGKLTTHWVDSGRVRKLLKPFFAEGLVKLDIEGSLAVNNTKMKLLDGPYCFNERNIRIFKDALENPKDSEKNLYVKNLLLKYLVDQGYFSIKDETSFKGYIEVIIPTYEVKKRLQELLDENSVQQSCEQRRQH